MSDVRGHLDLGPFARARGVVRLPGSKSISNRVLLLAALAGGTTEIRDLLASDDTERMLEALALLGVRIDRSGGDTVQVQGCGGVFPVKAAELFLGNAGTAFRPLTAVLALCGGHYRLSGVPRMHERPIGDLVDGLQSLGADIVYLGQPGLPPLEIRPASIRAGGRIAVRGDVSSQFLTALLIALPLTGTETTVEVNGELISKPYVDLTIATMARFGVHVARDGWRSFTIRAGQGYVSPGTVFVEGDASAASYFLAAGAVGGGPVRVEGVGRDSVQGDVRFGEALERLGARVATGDNWIEASAPAAGRLHAFDLDLNHIPDAAMTLAVVALFADGPSRLRNIASWRVKETDRIAAMATELRKVGATVEEGPDWLSVSPPAAGRLTPHAAIDTYDDHRMAMCFSLVALGDVPVRINDPKCVAKTFPDYFERFATIARPAPVIAIDGPSASGKGTVAERVAQALGFHLLDSGALYRLVALKTLRAATPPADEAGVARLAETLDAEFTPSGILLDGEPVGDALRAEETGIVASRVAALPAVRSALLARQRAFRRAPGLVADGRDMGSVVFADAELKIFLTASAEERAKRRYKQLMEKGLSATMRAILQDIEARDRRDAGRDAAPLQVCADAEMLDTTDLSIEEAVAFILARYRAVSSA
ncbi:MAG TPA: bifunctional 3-phosphoshikimate 1-carboxyvinyltransferase/cytidylate kinase [Burkholderiales bacterium]|nr:bifunctional 3-phosphoshikimate 1-carboxyvinyltransferase/cytidylate kinase [Burkholderiales bacterium]